MRSSLFSPNIIQNEKGTSSPTFKSNGPQLKSRTQSNPGSPSWNESSSVNPSNESKWGFKLISWSRSGLLVWKYQAFSDAEWHGKEKNPQKVTRAILVP